MTAPKAFISYSWTNPDHEAWVLRLATDLRESGIDTILDKWDLKEGQDAHVFMESMVADPEIKKVILICDKGYKEKADNRQKGVGTEAQIISNELYQQTTQTKFVAVVTERNDDGEAFVPIYYAARIYIDLSDPSTYASEFERLVRWVFDEPLFSKPSLGNKPHYLSKGDKPILATSARFQRAVDSVKNHRPHAVAAVAEYFETFCDELENLRLSTDQEPFDEAVIESIDAFLPYRNEAIQLIVDIGRNLDTDEARYHLHRFFENIIPYMSRPEGVNSWQERHFDNFKFIVHEMYLCAIASLIRFERFEFAEHLMSTEYYVSGNSDYGRDVMAPYGVFLRPLESLEHRNSRLKLNRLSLRADLLKKRFDSSGMQFRDLLQADFILFMRSEIHFSDLHLRWLPITHVYIERHNQAPFEIFARSKSKKYLERCKILLGIDSPGEMKPLLDAYASGERRVPAWNFTTFSPKVLLGYDKLGTSP